MKLKKDSLAPVLITFGIIFSFCSIGCDKKMALGAMKIIRTLFKIKSFATDISSKEEKCDWKSEMNRPLGSPAKCAADKCRQKKGKALMDCLNKKCSRFCGPNGAIYSGSTDTSAGMFRKEKKCDWKSEMKGLLCMKSVISECKQGKSYSYTREAYEDCYYKKINKRCGHLCKPNSGSTDTSSNKYNCDWLSKKKGYICMISVISECNYSYTREAFKDCFYKRIEKRCGHLCK